jgi:CopA family copper-resistance protein
MPMRPGPMHSGFPRWSRRSFVAGMAGGAALLAAPGHRLSATTTRTSDLSGTQFDLEIAEIPVNFTGLPRRAVAVNGGVPGPVLRWREGDEVRIRVHNRHRARSSIHWHGLIVPADMDGVPGISFHGIEPATTFEYRFRVNQSGTYWYHAHSRFQEQVGLYGSIVVSPRGQERHPADREHVILLSDWTDRDPEDIYRSLKIHPGYFNYGKRTARDLARDARSQGWGATLEERSMWARMRMDPTDLLDVSGYAYTYLMNGVTPAGNWTGLFERGERVRLRLINGSSMSFFDVRIPDLAMTVVAADGQDIEPVTVDEIRIAAAETFDVIVEPKHDRAYTLFAQAMDRSGYARGTLAPRQGMETDVPRMDARVALAMSDMGMGHAGHGDSSAPAQRDPTSHDEHATMDHGASHRPVSPQHAAQEFGPGVDMRVDQPLTRLDDPGVGLRNNGRRVLTYADLHTLDGPVDARDPEREIELHLTGHMERFMWSFNGEKFSQAEPLRFRYGERLRIVLVNDTMMTHPIHLHGMWSEVESPEQRFQIRKHTVSVQPAQRVSYRIAADALGHWAYHCHLLYHMEAGMFREVVVEHAGGERT